LVDSGIRSGLGIVRMLALGARGVLLGRPYVYALAADGEKGVSNLLELLATEMRVAIILCGASSVSKLSRNNLVELNRHL
jgi:L-lactate dehydrogenase (cytochrome)